jgi:hypothetical protein
MRVIPCSNKKWIASRYAYSKNSEYFSKMIAPVSCREMIRFIYMHDGIHLFDTSIIKKICESYYMSGLQLDAFFILARYTHQFFSSLKSVINNFWEKEIGTIPLINLMPHEMKDIVYSTDFQEKIIEYTFDNLSTRTTKETFIEDFVEDIYYYFDQNEYYDDSFIKENILSLTPLISTLYEKIFTEVNILLLAAKNILSLCEKTLLTPSEELALENFINSTRTVVPVDYATDSIMKQFSDYVRREYAYDDVYYGRPENSANILLSKIGFEVANIGTVSNQLYMHSIVACFVEHNFVTDSLDITKLILHTLINERCTPAYANKYDNMTLYEHYVLISMANDSKFTYDSVINKIGATNKIPLEFPVEIILGILGRLFNIIIELYSEKLTLITIDNSLDYTTAHLITIFQYTSDDYYNIIPKGKIFEPTVSKSYILGENLKEILSKSLDEIRLELCYNPCYDPCYDPSKLCNDINDVVEI